MKLYPFNIQKHAHSIEFRRNRVFCEMREAEMDTSVPAAECEKLERLHDDLTELLEAVLNSRDGRIAYLTGPQIGLAKECVAWADHQRAGALIAAGKTEYMKYL